jgi:protoheme ferro-lyase
MKKIPLITMVIITILMLSTFTVVAKQENAPGQLKEKNEKNQNAPGQWKKIYNYSNQSDFVNAVHLRIWNRLQAFGVCPPGLMKLLMIILEIPEETTSEQLEEIPEEEPPEDPPEEPPEEPTDPEPPA